mmetsp:Transcript_82602/g.210130  ORF Transcript_82602/g.210130 Transcript_82602/m.210130 type:complete len:206 (-) Transcript_82602:8-625(-)
MSKRLADRPPISSSGPHGVLPRKDSRRSVEPQHVVVTCCRPQVSAICTRLSDIALLDEQCQRAVQRERLEYRGASRRGKIDVSIGGHPVDHQGVVHVVAGLLHLIQHLGGGPTAGEEHELVGVDLHDPVTGRDEAAQQLVLDEHVVVGGVGLNGRHRVQHTILSSEPARHPAQPGDVPVVRMQDQQKTLGLQVQTTLVVLEPVMN